MSRSPDVSSALLAQTSEEDANRIARIGRISDKHGEAFDVRGRRIAIFTWTPAEAFAKTDHLVFTLCRY